MSNLDQNQLQAYPPSFATTAPHPYADQSNDGEIAPPPPGETKSKGDGFWKGFCAGLCCYCCLDACF
ncbi:hypothetical protein AB3S75_028235 [Citrus x aurantiifolia]